MEADVKAPEITSAAMDLFDQFLNVFAQAAGPELLVDGVQHFSWRITMFFRLSGISEKEVEERILGLSPEFHLNMLWLPGARVVDHALQLEPGITPHVEGLIEYYWQAWPDMQYINVGRVETSQTLQAPTRRGTRDLCDRPGPGGGQRGDPPGKAHEVGCRASFETRHVHLTRPSTRLTNIATISLID